MISNHVNRIAPKAQTRPQDSLNVVNFHSGRTSQSEAPQGVSSLDLPAGSIWPAGPLGQPMPNSANYRYLFKLGLDTSEIARLFKVTEAEVYNFLAKDRGLK